MGSFRSLIQSEGVRNFGKLLSANVVAQAIGLVVYPILTRLYAPDDFGLLNLFLSIGGVLVILATAEYQYAIVLPKEDEKARAVVQVCIELLLFTTGIILISVPFSQTIATLFKAPDLAKWFWMMPFFVLSMGGWNILNYWYTRKKDFNSVSCYQMSQSTLSAASKIGMGYCGCHHFGLIVGSVCAPIFAIVANILSCKKELCSLRKHTNRQERQEALKEYRNFPLYTLPRSFVNNLSSNLPALLLTPFFGLTPLGYFGMACTISMRPVLLITNTIHQIMYERVAHLVRESLQIRGTLLKLYIPLTTIVLLLMVALWHVTPTLVKYILGMEWMETARYIRYMLPWLTCVFIVAPLAFISDIFGKQRLFLIIECIYFLLRVLAMAIGIYLKNFNIAILLLSGVGTCVLTVQLIFYLHFIRQYELTRKML